MRRISNFLFIIVGIFFFLTINKSSTTAALTTTVVGYGYFNATFQPCQNPSPNSQLWNFTGSPNVAGMLQPVISTVLCLVPTNCSSASSVPLVINYCNVTSYCNNFVYDTFTYFTFTNTNSSLLITDNGQNLPATQESSTGTENQQFMYNPSTMTIIPADNSNLCLTLESE